MRTASGPSALRITDLRIATILGHGYYPILRIDTNQGVYGLGEVRDGASPDTALRLKHLLLGQNPCNVDYLFKMIANYGGDSREAGGVCGIEIALMDLVGKVYGIPCYQLLGGKYRDKVRLYGDTPAPDDADARGLRRGGDEAQGARPHLHQVRPAAAALRADAGRAGRPGDRARILAVQAVVRPRPRRRRPHQPGRVELCVDITRAVREAVGDEISLCTDHFGEGFCTADEAIRIGHALEPFNLAWIEDPLPWTDIAGHKKVADALLTPVAAGEDWYAWDGFREAIETRAVDIIHPDMLSSGGLIETKRIADHAERFDIPTALHACCSPVGFMANVHLGAAIASLVAVEHHGLDLPFFREPRDRPRRRLHGGRLRHRPGRAGPRRRPQRGGDPPPAARGRQYFADTSEWNRNRVGPEWAPHDD